MSIKKVLGRVGIVLSVAAMVVLVGGCIDEDDLYNNDPVTINGLTWTKNINVNTDYSWCYDDDNSNCAKYGRLYTWEAAKSVCASMGGGYRLPTRADWNNLVNYAGGATVAGKTLKSTSGWSYDRNGTDNYGFSALPGGKRDSYSSFLGAGGSGYWWSATELELGSNLVYYLHMYYSGDGATEDREVKSRGFSVRCVSAAQ